MNKENTLPMWIEEKGLSFKCTECGACCTGSPGHVWLEENDLLRLAKHLEIDREDFLKTYCKLVNGKYSLLEDEKTYDCIFLNKNKCSLYNARPKQCRTYPFWNEIIKNKTSWAKEQKHCEGINHKDSKFISRNEILSRRKPT